MRLWETKIHHSVHKIHNEGNAHTVVSSNTCITLLGQDKCQPNNVLRIWTKSLQFEVPRSKFSYHTRRMMETRRKSKQILKATAI